VLHRYGNDFVSKSGRRELLEDLWEKHYELLAHDSRVKSRCGRKRLDVLGAEPVNDLLRRHHPGAVPGGQRRRDVPQAPVLKLLQDSGDSAGHGTHELQHLGSNFSLSLTIGFLSTTVSAVMLSNVMHPPNFGFVGDDGMADRSSPPWRSAALAAS
jgi:hypothetical protein